MQAAERPLISVEDYLQGEKVSEVRHEYVDGRVYAMTGASKNHNRLTQRLARLIGDGLTGGGCEAFASDVKVRISHDEEERFFYPDLLVECPPLTEDAYYAERPILVVEVLSRSTERADRSDKFHSYRRLHSLQEYVLVAQDAQRVEVYRRGTQWDLDLYGPGDLVRLDSIGFSLPVAQLYTGIELRND